MPFGLPTGNGFPFVLQPGLCFVQDFVLRPKPIGTDQSHPKSRHSVPWWDFLTEEREQMPFVPPLGGRYPLC